MGGVVTGALFVFAIRWTGRLVGFASTLILARLLVPEDFGIVAMAYIVIGLADVLLDLGIGTALIQNKTPTQAHYDSAWTLGIAQSLFAMIFVACSAHWAATFFNEPRVVPVLLVLSLSFPLGALGNVGMVTYQKELRFDVEFKVVFAGKLATFMVTVAAAWITRSYWALIIGNLFGRVFGLVVSYIAHPMRPRLSIEKAREIFSFSQWVMAKNFVSFFENKTHQMVVGRRESAAQFGAYTIADEVAAMPTTELLAPLNRVLFPAFVRVKDDAEELKRVFLMAQAVQATIGIPAGVGMILVAPEAVSVLLGANWSAATPFLQAMALINVCQAVSTSGGYILLTLGHARLLTMYSAAQLALFGVVALVLMPSATAGDIAWIRLWVAGAGLLCMAFLIRTNLSNVTFHEMVKSLFRPVVGAACMFACVSALAPLMQFPPGLLLVVKIIFGALVYVGAVGLLWLLAGRPPGAEAYLLHNISTFLRTRRGAA